MAQDRERSKQRKTQDSEEQSTRFAEAAGEGVSGNEVIGSSFFARAQQRRSRSGGHGRAKGQPGTREEGPTPMPSMDDIARGYGVDRNEFYGSRSRETLGLETDQSFANRAEAISPSFGDNLGAGPGYGEERGSDLGPGLGANRAFGYGAVPSFGSSSPRSSASSTGSDVGYGTPGYGEHSTLRGRSTSGERRAEQHRGASSRTEQGGRSHPVDTRSGLSASGNYPEASFEHQRYTEERARSSDEPFDRGSIWGTVNLPPTGSPSEAAAWTDRETRRSRWRREPLEARDIMTRDVKAVHPDTSLRDAVRIMRDQNTGIVPVVNADDVL
ncbi:MAG TPA: CBS domain-containing protein, partial [Gemmatimonadaceae bacterium]|nr:CBS domain-containing protein [Gemmatimonadaceae bacterium]